MSRGFELESASMGLSHVVEDNSCLISTPPSSKGAEMSWSTVEIKSNCFKLMLLTCMQRNQQERQECNDQEPHARQMLLSKGIELENAGMRL